MHETKTWYCPWLHRDVKFSTWRNGDAEIIPRFVDKSRAWRPTQQRPRDGIIVRSMAHGRGTGR